MTRKLPTKLDQDTIFEASFEIRFSPSDESAYQLLPGMMLPGVRDYVTHFDSDAGGDIPRELVQKNPDLAYRATRRLLGDHFALAFGPKVMLMTVRRPYLGWDRFRSAICSALETLRSTGMVSNVERFSLRYRNMVPAHSDDADQFDRLKVSLNVADFDIEQHSKRVSVETPINGFQNIVNISTQTSVEVGATGEHLTGILVDIDTIRMRELEDFWNKRESLLEDAHTTEKSVFFGLLTDETLRDLQPRWDES